MHYSRQSYKSLADYDYHRVIDQKRNLAQVQKVLTMYENNNQSLVDQVRELIRENEMLRKQHAKSPKMSKSKLQPYKPPYSVTEHTENCQVNTSVRSTTHKRHNTITSSKIRLNHPRDVYLPPEQAHLMNMKRLRQARTAHKTYDKEKEFEQFKQKLSAKKEELKNEYKKKVKRENTDLSLSRKVYIDRPQVETQEFSERKPLVEVEKVQPLTFNLMPSYKFQKRDNSPYNQFKKQTPQPSPSKATARSYKQPPKSAQRSSSAIKIQQVYPENSIKIAEPKTKWGDLSSTYFQRSKWLQQDQNALIASSKLYYEKMGQPKEAKTKKKKFLNVVSLSVLEEKLQQKA